MEIFVNSIHNPDAPSSPTAYHSTAASCCLKMNCSCRTAALGIFVRSVTNHHISATAASRLSQCAPLTSSIQRLYAFDNINSALSGTSSRSFHTTCAKGSAQEAAAATPRHNDWSTDVDRDGRRHTRPRARDADRATDQFHKPGGRKFGDTFMKKAPTVERRKPDWPSNEPETKEEEVRKPSLHEKILEEKEETEEFQGREYWKAQKAALKEKFPNGWNPLRKLSPDALAGIRAIHKQFPEEYSTPVLAERFKLSPEAIRRILKSKWTPTPEEEQARQERWFNRGKSVWSRWAEAGKKPPVKWRQEGIVRDPIWNQKKNKKIAGGKDVPLDKEEKRAAKKEKRRVFRIAKKGGSTVGEPDSEAPKSDV